MSILRQSLPAVISNTSLRRGSNYYPVIGGDGYGPELLSNSDFSSGSTNWIFTNPPFSVSGGKANYDDTINGGISQNVSFGVGEYMLTLDISNATTAFFKISSDRGTLINYSVYNNGLNKIPITISATGAYIEVYATTSGSIFSFDCMSWRKKL